MFRQITAVTAAAALIWGCSDGEGTIDDGGPTDVDPTDASPTDGVTDTDTDTDTPTDSGTTPSTTASTGDTGGTTSGVVLDCAALSPTPISSRIVPMAKAHHGLAFDAYGMLLGLSNGNVIAYDAYGGFAVYSPGLGTSEQFDMAPDGNLYAATFSNIVQIAPSGAQTNVGGPSGTYGLKVGPDGKIYAANNSDMVRIDVAGGTQETYIAGGGGRAPRVMDWSPDLTRMYIGNFGGSVDYVDLDANLDPIGAPRVLAPNLGSFKDGMLVDVCGYVYLALYDEQALMRIDPTTGNVSYLFDLPNLTNYGHGMQFGSGIGGWRDDALYLPNPYNNDTVSEVVIGVYHRSWTGGTVINAP